MKLYYLRKLEKISTNTSSIGIIFMEIPNEYFDFHKNTGMTDIFWHSQNVEILMLSWVKERCPCPSFIYVYTGFTLKLEKLEIRKIFHSVCLITRSLLDYKNNLIIKKSHWRSCIHHNANHVRRQNFIKSRYS